MECENKEENLRNSNESFSPLKQNAEILKSSESLESKTEHRKSMINSLKGKITIPKKSLQVADKDPFYTEYEELEKIGEGSHAYVMKVLHRSTNKLYAAKIYAGLVEESIITVQNEFNALKQLDHPNIVHPHEMFVNEEKKIIRIIMEYVDTEKMARKIQSRTLKERDIALIFLQIFDCLSYMHLKGICHRDLKPSNIMVDKQFCIKIIDFSASKLFKLFDEVNTMITPIGTPAYKAPELFSEESYGEKVDMWAAGVILYESLYNRKPFAKDNLEDLIREIEKGKIKFSEEDLLSKNFSTLSIDLMKKLLTRDPIQRVSATEAIKHPWLASFLK